MPLVPPSSFVAAAGASAAVTSIIPTVESTPSQAYVTLTTPDQVIVPGVLSTSIIGVLFQALWTETTTGAAAAAAIFVNGSQLLDLVSGAAPSVQEAAFGGGLGVNAALISFAGGLFATNPAGNASLTTPHALFQVAGQGGVCYVLPGAAGSCTIDVRYKANSAAKNVQVQARTLMAWLVA